jgi:hypothetical protein
MHRCSRVHFHEALKRLADAFANDVLHLSDQEVTEGPHSLGPARRRWPMAAFSPGALTEPCGYGWGTAPRWGN